VPHLPLGTGATEGEQCDPKGVECISEGQRPGIDFSAQTKAPKGRNKESIPNIPFVIFNTVLVQKFNVLLLKSFLTVVFFLIGDIPCLRLRCLIARFPMPRNLSANKNPDIPCP
jgi:hypothetical protein